MTSGEATGGALPPSLYTGPEAFQRERRTVFQSSWLLLTRTDALHAPGAYVAQSLGGWPVFAIAGADGMPGVFRNVCRHQGLPLLDTGNGTCAQIRCRYHGWTYGIDGRLMTAPPQVLPPDPADPLHQLERVAAERFHGLLFAHLGGAPDALESALDDLAAALAAANFDGLPFHAETVTDIDANWKIVMEQTLAMAPPDISRRAIWPNLILDAVAGGVVIHQVIPRAFQRTRIHRHHYAAPEFAVPLVERTGTEADGLRSASLAAQAHCRAGTSFAVAVIPPLANFRDRVRAAHGVAT